MNRYATIAVALVALSQQVPAADKKPLTRSESIQLGATVESIDQVERTLVLKGDSGARVVVVAGPDVRNLNQIRTGDRILLTYIIGVAVQVKPRGTPASGPVEASTEEHSAPGKNPSASAGYGVFTTVKIDSIDTSFNTVTFKRADGITRVVAVNSPDGQRFIRTLKPGDSVEIAYTEAMAVSVQPAAAMR